MIYICRYTYHWCFQHAGTCIVFLDHAQNPNTHACNAPQVSYRIFRARKKRSLHADLPIRRIRTCCAINSAQPYATNVLYIYVCVCACVRVCQPAAVAQIYDAGSVMQGDISTTKTGLVWLEGIIRAATQLER